MIKADDMRYLCLLVVGFCLEVKAADSRCHMNYIRSLL